MRLQSSFTMFVDPLFEQHLIESQRLALDQAMHRQMLKDILYGRPMGKVSRVGISGYHFHANPSGEEIAKKALRDIVLPTLEIGVVVLNNNITENMLIGQGSKQISLFTIPLR